MQTDAGHLRSSEPVTEVVVADLQADLTVEPAGDRVRAWGEASASICLSERSGVVTLRGSRAGPRVPPGLTVEVPAHCALTLRAVSGRVRVGDIGGRLTLDLAGDVDVRAGRVATARVQLRGRGGRVAIAAVEGRVLDVDVVGSGRVSAAGTVERLRARVLGAGTVSFHGDAEVAELGVHGVGQISVLRVVRHLSRWCVGAGDARVSHPPRPAFRASATPEPVGIGRVGT